MSFTTFSVESMEKYYYVMGMRFIPDLWGSLRKLNLYSGNPDYYVARAACEKFAKSLRTENPRRVKLPIRGTSTAAEASGLLRAGAIRTDSSPQCTEVMMKVLIYIVFAFVAIASIYTAIVVMEGMRTEAIERALDQEFGSASVPVMVTGSN